MHSNANHHTVAVFHSQSEAKEAIKNLNGHKVYRRVTEPATWVIQIGTKFLAKTDIQSANDRAIAHKKEEHIMAKKSIKPAATETVVDDLTGDETVVTHNPTPDTKAGKKAVKKTKPEADDLMGDEPKGKRGKGPTYDVNDKYAPTAAGLALVESRPESHHGIVASAFRKDGTKIGTAITNLQAKMTQARGTKGTEDKEAFVKGYIRGSIKRGYIAKI